MRTHKEGLLHRAFSVFVFNSNGELLLQRRAPTKYHSPGLWSNTCCGHPRPEEQLLIAGCRRLKAEMGLSCELQEISSFVYRADVDHGLIEHEYDHVLIGQSDSDPTLNLDEAIDWKWTSLEVLEQEVHDYPGRFTFWLKTILDSEMLSSVR